MFDSSKKAGFSAFPGEEKFPCYLLKGKVSCFDLSAIFPKTSDMTTHASEHSHLNSSLGL